MRIKLSILVLLSLLATSILAPAIVQAVPTAANAAIPVGQIGGVTNAAVFSGGQLYFNVGPRIAKMTVTSPLTPQPAVYGDILPGIPEDIKVANGYVYIAMGRAGVAIVDATTLATVGTQALPMTDTLASAVAVSSNSATRHLYVAVGLAGIVEYSLGADNKTLTGVQTKTFTSPARRVTDVETRVIPPGPGAGEYLFASANNFSGPLAGRGGVLKFDITTAASLGDPTDIKEQIDVNALGLTDAYVYAVGGTTFYALDTFKIGTTGQTYTVTLPSSGENIAVRPDGSTAYVINGGGGVDVVDVTAPTAPAVIGDPFFTNGLVKNLAAAEFPSDSNTYLYVADRGAGLSIASAPQAAPQDLTLNSSSYVKPKPAIAGAVAVAYPLVFAANSTTPDLWTLNTATLSSLSPVGSGLTLKAAINSMTVYGNSLLISAGDDGLLRYQINPASDPGNMDSVGTAGAAYQAAVVWPNAVVANGISGLAVVDISDPLTMTVIGTAPAPLVGNFKRVDVQGNFAYVADDGGGVAKNGSLRVYDLTDPDPALRGTVSQTGILDVKASGNFAFLAVGPGGIRVADISNPDAPVILNTDDYTGTTNAQSLVVYKNYLFAAEGEAGVQMLAVQPTGQLNLVTSIPTSGAANQLVWAPGSLYVADDIGGLVAIQIGNDLAITKTAPVSVYAGQDFTYTLSIGNVGALDATGVVVTDVLPTEVSFVSASSNCSVVSGTVTCALAALNVGASASFNVVVKPTAVDTISNTASVSSDFLDVDPSNNSSSVTVTALPAADLVITKTAPISAYQGQNFTYTLSVSNLGPSAAAGGVVTDVLPANVLFVAAPGCSSSAGTVTCATPGLNVGASSTFNLVVESNAVGVYTNTATVAGTAADLIVNNNSSSATTTVLPVADLSITKTASPDPATINQPLTYTLTVSNNGPSAATGVIVTDTLPSGVTLASASAGCAGTTAIVCNVGVLNNGSSATVSIAVTVTIGAGSLITNTAVATANEQDFTPATASVGTTVLTFVKYQVMLPLVRR